MDGKINVELEGNLLHVILTTCSPGQESRLELKADGEVVQVSGQVSGATFQRVALELIGSLPELIGPLTGAAAPTGASLLLSKLPDLVQSFAQAVGGNKPGDLSDVLGESVAVVCDHCPKRWTPDGLLRRPVPECAACPVASLPPTLPR